MHILQFEAETLKSDTMNWYSCIKVFDIIDIIISSSRHENYIINAWGKSAEKKRI